MLRLALPALLLASSALAAEPERRAGSSRSSPGVNVNAWTTGRILILKDQEGAYAHSASAQSSGTVIEGGGHSLAYGGVRPDPKALDKQPAATKASGGSAGGGPAGGPTPGTASSSGPAYGSISPGLVTIGLYTELTIDGARLEPGALLRFSGPMSFDRRARFVSSERLVSSGTLAATVTPGDYKTTLVNPDGKESSATAVLPVNGMRVLAVGAAFSRPALPPGAHEFFQLRETFTAPNALGYSIGDQPPPGLRFMWKQGCNPPSIEDFEAVWAARISSPNGILRNGSALRLVDSGLIENALGPGSVCAGFLVYNGGTAPTAYTFTSWRPGAGQNCRWERSGNDFGPFPPAPTRACTTANQGEFEQMGLSRYTCTCGN